MPVANACAINKIPNLASTTVITRTAITADLAHQDSHRRVMRGHTSGFLRLALVFPPADPAYSRNRRCPDAGAGRHHVVDRNEPNWAPICRHSRSYRKACTSHASSSCSLIPKFRRASSTIADRVPIARRASCRSICNSRQSRIPELDTTLGGARALTVRQLAAT